MAQDSIAPLPGRALRSAKYPGGLKRLFFADDYRKYVATLCPEVGVVRDLCDFGKHGPKSDRTDVQVTNTRQQRRVTLDASAFVMGIPTHAVIQKLVISMKDATGTDPELNSIVRRYV